MEESILFWGYKEQESNLIVPEHDDDDDDEQNVYLNTRSFSPSLTMYLLLGFRKFPELSARHKG